VTEKLEDAAHIFFEGLEVIVWTEKCLFVEVNPLDCVNYYRLRNDQLVLTEHEIVLFYLDDVFDYRLGVSIKNAFNAHVQSSIEKCEEERYRA